MRPIQLLILYVGHDSRRSFQVVPDEWNLERLANEAVPPVTPHEKLASDLLFAGRTEHGRGDAAMILLETVESHTMLDAKSQLCQTFTKQLARAPLWQHPEIWVWDRWTRCDDSVQSTSSHRERPNVGAKPGIVTATSQDIFEYA